MLVSRCWTKKDNLQDEMPFNFDFLAYVKFESNLMHKNFTWTEIRSIIVNYPSHLGDH